MSRLLRPLPRPRKSTCLPPLAAGVGYDTQSDEAENAATIYDRLRALQGEPMVVQLNHPHWDGASLRLDWFEVDNNNFQPTQPVPATFGDGRAPNAFLRKPSTVPGSTTQGIDFDAIEILGGGQTRDWLATRTDWFSLLNQGFLKIGTANSDSHKMTRTAGYPRTYVQVPDDSPTTVSADQIREGLLAGGAIGTTGPFLDLEVDGEGLGRLVTDSDGEVSVGGTVAAAPWIEVGEVRIVRNGQLVWSLSLAPGDPEPVVRWQGTVALPVTKDSWFILEAGSSLPADPLDPMYVPPTMRKLVPTNIVPMAFTNPVYVDADGDGAFTSPGPGS